ncbi:MAG: phosphatase PAP2 family protein [Pseudomonadota bacterium]
MTRLHTSSRGAGKASVPQGTHAWRRWWVRRHPRQKWACAGIAAGFLCFHAALGGLRADHVLLAAVYTGLYYGGPKLRPAYRLLLPLVLMLAAFDAQRYIAADWRLAIHVAAPYRFDERFFGISTTDGVLLPSQWLQLHTGPILDGVTSVAYIAFVPFYIAVAGYFYWRPAADGARAERQAGAVGMMWAMLWLNLAGSVTYYLYPAAPPWYVDLYGLGPARPDALPSAAGAARFDALFGVSWFRDYYALTPNVFGAIPSLHVAIPLLAVIYAFRFGALRLATTGYFLLVCFSALYLNHHYVVDLLWGAFYAVAVGMVMIMRVPRSPRPQSRP